MPNSEQSDQHHETQLKDVAQIVIGAGMLALPVSMSEDTWDIAKTLPTGNVIGIVCASILLISGFVTLREFGYLTAMTMAICLSTDLGLLPALLIRARA